MPRASAIDPFPTTGVVALSSDHFTVHYTREDEDPACKNFITQEQAGDLLAMFEEAYRQFHNVMGYPVPVDDGDGKVDVSVDDFTHGCVPYGTIPPSTPFPYDRWDGIIAPNGVQPGSDDIHLNAETGRTFHIVSHELFHLMEDAIAPGADQWLQEGTAEWAAVRADLATGGDEANPDRTMDCVGAECGDTDFDKNGYPGWMLFEYLAERYGDAKVRAVWDQAAVSGPGTPGTTILAAVLPVSLGTFFNDYTTARLTGNFTSPLLAGTLPAAYAILDVPETNGWGRCRQPPGRQIHRVVARVKQRAVLRGVADSQRGHSGRRAVDSDLLREYQRRERPAVDRLRFERHYHRAVEHVHGQS